MKCKYKFSVIIPVYNAEEYLEGTINSIINQTIGFKENIQLVLVNDGSKDDSEIICLNYKRKYKDNIVYHKQKNAGVSEARNVGISLATGELVNFLDSDDKWSPNAFQEVWDHYCENNQINVFTTKMRYFDGKNCPHILNYKYKEDKIVDIRNEEDRNYFQLSTCSCFIKRSVLKKYKYDKSIKNEEDTKLISEILLDNYEMMVLKEPIYYYRSRANLSSASQTSIKNKLWYTVTPTKVYEYLFEESKKKFGKILGYFKSLIAYDIIWRLSVPVPNEILTEKEKEDYIKCITNLINQVELEYFMEQKNIYSSLIIFLSKLRGEFNSKICLVQEKGIMKIEGYSNKNNTLLFMKIDDIYVQNGQIHIYGKINEEIYSKEQLRINVDGSSIIPEFYNLKAECIEQAFNDEYISKFVGVKCIIDLKNIKKFGFTYGENNEKMNLSFSNQCVLTNALDGSYYTYGRKMIMYNNGEFKVKRKSIFRKIGREVKNTLGLLKRKKYKVVLMRYFIRLTKLFAYRNVWLLSDRINMADDNAEHVFKYLISNKVKGIRPYYVLNKNSKDYERMKKIGRVVDNNSLKYKILFHNAKCIISSHAEPYITNIYGKSNQYYADLFKFKYIFLQHGITKDDISPWLNPNTRHIDMFVSAVKDEYDSLEKTGYEKDVIQLTGFPRYDGLVKKSDEYEKKKTIFLSFTWRSKLVHKINKNTGERMYNPDFKKSDYFKWLNELLNSKKLFDVLKENGYTIKVIPHPNLIAQLKDFKINPKYIEVVESDIDYQREFCESSVLVTDRSSIFFDFAYLKKPIVYYQPDNETFFENQIYEQGYFEYEEDGFGPVTYTKEEFINELSKILKNNCELEEKYRKRIEKFFTFNDANNCKRVVERIKKIENN